MLEALDSNQQTILLVEDDPSEIAFAHEACELCGPSVQLVVVEDSVEALSWLSRNAQSCLPNLILLDLKLPKLSGLAVLRRLRMDAKTQDLPIIVFSEVCEQSDVLLSYQIGANSFVKKPADINQFQELLRELVSYWLLPRQRQANLVTQ
jgi:two-component system response regulator